MKQLVCMNEDGILEVWERAPIETHGGLWMINGYPEPCWFYEKDYNPEHWGRVVLGEL